MSALSTQRSFILPYRHHPASIFGPVFTLPPRTDFFCAKFFCIEMPDFSEMRIYGEFCAEYFSVRGFLVFESGDRERRLVYRAWDSNPAQLLPPPPAPPTRRGCAGRALISWTHAPPQQHGHARTHQLPYDGRTAHTTPIHTQQLPDAPTQAPTTIQQTQHEQHQPGMSVPG
jgi:hypothetical protein